MSSYFTTKQTKAVKTLLFNQDLDNENIQLLKGVFKSTDTSDMTIDEAQSIIDKMSQAKKDAANNIILGKVKPFVPTPRHYYMERNAEYLSKSIGLNILIGIFLIGTVAFGITLACIAFTGIWGFLCGVFKYMRLILTFANSKKDSTFV